jgi:D-apionolactonase
VSRGAVRLAGGRPVQLGPVTLRPRFNAVATGDDRRTGAPDPLQGTGFAAVWTLGSVSALTRPGVEGLCFYEVTGPGGIGGVGGLHPVGELLTTLAPLRGHDVLTARAPSGIAAYPVRTPEGVRVLLGRLGGTPLTCEVSGPGGTHGSVLLEPWSTAEVRLS